MTDYLDLIQYGAFDLQRSEELFKNSDYNFAAFCAQQALEKHLKGYMMKFGIFETVEQLGHLQYPKIIEKMIELMKESDDSDEMYSRFMEKNIQFFDFIQKLLNDIATKPEKKILFWKESLDIPLNSHERNLSDGIEVELLRCVSELQNSVLVYFASDPFNLQKIDDKKLDNEGKFIVEKLNSLQNNLTKASQTIDDGQSNAVVAMDDLEELVNSFAYGTGKDSMSKKETKKFVEYIKTFRSLQWMFRVIDSYPHVVISRYPIEIDGKDPRIFYEENKENLWKLIQRIKDTCMQIRESCN